MPQPHARSHGFSLVELSIVLVILGLLTGGILAGQSLIRAAEMRAITTEYARYSTAVQSFRDKYFAIPGDFNNASAFWGNAGGTGCTNNSGTSVTSPGTCDGDGDGNVEWGNAASQTGEVFQFWRQLALAGLVEGNYTGNAGPVNVYDSVIGSSTQNIPKSRLGGAGWGTQYMGSVSGSVIQYTADYGNMFGFGAASPGTQPYGYILKPEDAWNIDSKLDDGLPGSGRILATNWSACAKASSATDYTSGYNLTSTQQLCSLMFRNQY